MPAARTAVLLCLLLFPAGSAAQTRVSPAVARSPMTFEENRGQTDARVRFLSRGKGYTLFLAPDEAVFSLGDTDRGASTMRMALVDAQPPDRITGVDPLPGKSHYLLGSDPRRWTTDVPTYAQVRYEGVYRGIDLIYYGNQYQLEYDFSVAAGADPRVIRLRFAGATRLRLAPDGDLVMDVDGREVRLRRPVAFQRGRARREVPVAYALTNSGDVRFRIGAYDPALPLIIDPVVLFSTYWSEEFGGISGIAADASGAVYVSGTAGSTEFPTTPGAWQETNGGSGFVTKFDASGAVVYSTYLGGHGSNFVYSIAVDRFGAAYVTGLTDAADFPTTPNAFQPSCTQYPPGGTLAGTCYAGFVAKLNPVGSALEFSTYLGGAGILISGAGTYPADIAVDDALDVYLTGSTSPEFPVTPGVFQPTYAGGPFMPFVAKMNATGTDLLYASYLGGARGDTAKHIAIDAQGNAYVTGQATSPDFPTTPGALRRTCREREVIGGGCSIAFVAKIDVTATSLVYSTFLGGVGDALGAAINGLSSEGTGIAVDGEGHAYLTGTAYTADFPTTSGSLKPVNTSSWDAFVAKLNLDGTGLVYSTYLGGNFADGPFAGQELGGRITIDAAGHAYVAGRTSSTDFPLVTPVQATRGGGVFDVFVARLNPGGSALLFSTFLGGAGDEENTALAVDEAGSIHVGGLTNSPDFPTVNAVRPDPLGSRSGFVATIGEAICGADVTGQVQVFRSAIVPFFWPFNLQIVIVWNSSPSPVGGPLAYVMDDLQNAVFVGPSKTRCFSPEGDPLTLVPLGGDNVLAPNEAVLIGLWFYQTQPAPISYTPRLLSGPRNR